MSVSRVVAVCVAGSLVACGSALAQTPAPAPMLFKSAGDVSALIERAKRERKPDQPNFAQPIVQLKPYTANLEYRVAGLNAPASVHEKDVEFFYVVDGTASLVTGGSLKDERRTNADNLQGSAIDGGNARRIGKGDVIVVPAKTPHWFTQLESVLVLMSLHVPSVE